jgi:hypothetical protein
VFGSGTGILGKIDSDDTVAVVVSNQGRIREQIIAFDVKVKGRLVTQLHTKGRSDGEHLADFFVGHVISFSPFGQRMRTAHLPNWSALHHSIVYGACNSGHGKLSTHACYQNPYG